MEKGGKWIKLDLIDQGRKVQKNIEKCPKTWETLKNLPLAIDNGLAYVYFSVIYPNTHISSHCGPVNFKLRCHLPLFSPSRCFLHVAHGSRQFEDGKLLIFDDSFSHFVVNDGDDIRVVLLIDVWHPDLTQKEIDVLNKLLPPPKEDD